MKEFEIIPILQVSCKLNVQWSMLPASISLSRFNKNATEQQQ